MPNLRILSGGAAQGLVTALEAQFQASTGYGIDGTFGAVGAMRAKLQAGELADVIILTSALIAELAREGLALGTSVADLGAVATSVAVRTGGAMPSIANAAELRTALQGADAIYFPDPEQATAGIHFAGVLERLGIGDEVAGRLETFPNGATAMKALAVSKAARPIGCTQATEILNTPGVTLAGPLPAGYELATVYTAAVVTRTAHPDAAGTLVATLAGEGAGKDRESAGFISV